MTTTLYENRLYKLACQLIKLNPVYMLLPSLSWDKRESFLWGSRSVWGNRSDKLILITLQYDPYYHRILVTSCQMDMREAMHSQLYPKFYGKDSAPPMWRCELVGCYYILMILSSTNGSRRYLKTKQTKGSSHIRPPNAKEHGFFPCKINPDVNQTQLPEFITVSLVLIFPWKSLSL